MTLPANGTKYPTTRYRWPVRQAYGSLSQKRVIPPASDQQDSKDSPMAGTRFTLEDRVPADYFTNTLKADVLHGLAHAPRSLTPKWF